MTARSVLARLLWTVAGLLMLLAIAATLAFWLGGRQATLQALVRQAVEATGGKLSVDGVQGSLYGPLKIARLSYEDERRRISAENIELAWTPRALLRRTLVLDNVAIGRLDVTTKQASTEPPKPPASLRLPLAVQAADISIGQLNIVNAGGTTTISAIRGAFASSRAEHRLQIARAETPWGTIQGHASLAADAPFALDAEASLAGSLPPEFSVDAKARGPLAALTVSARGTTGPATIDARLGVNSFSAMPPKTIKLAARNLNLQRLRASLPLTALTATLDGELDEQGNLAGMLAIDNALPGKIDEGKIPLKALAAAVAGDIKRWQADELRLDLGAAGQFRGTAEGQRAALRLALSTINLNLNGIQSKLRPTRLAGELSVDVPSAEVQRVTANLAERQIRIRLDATRDGNLLRLAQGELASRSGRLTLGGELQLAGNKKFQAAGKLNNFNPAEFGNLPPARVNATLMTQGELTPAPRGNLQFTLTDSQWRGQVLAGQGKLQFATDRVADVNIDLAVGQNRLSAKGDFGRANDVLAWSIDAPRFQELDPNLSGSLQGGGHLRGGIKEPALDFVTSGRGLTLPGGYHVASLDGRGNLGSGHNGSVNADLSLKGLASGRWNLAAATLQAAGTRSRHTLILTAAQPGTVDLHVEASGGWTPQAGWQGVLQRLENKGTYAIALQAPAPVAMGRDHAQTSSLVLLAAEGKLAVDQLQWSAGQLITRGSLGGLSLAYLQKLFPQQLRADDVAASLRLGGEWDIQVADEINGRLRLGREQGDIMLLSEPKLPLDLTALELTAEAKANRITVNMAIAGAAVGAVGGHLMTVVERRNGAWGIPGSAPLDYTATADMPSLAWLTLLIGDRVALAGRAQFSYTRQGTMAAGRYDGKLSADNLGFRVPEYGVNLKDGVLRASFDGAKLALEQFVMHAERGTLSATGAFNLGKDTAEGGVHIRADQLALLDHPDYQLTVTGAGNVALKNGGLAITGEVRADEGQITLPKSNAPTLGDDVVVVGQKESVDKKRAITSLQIDVELDLGEHFTLRGRGIAAQLGGQLRVRSAAAASQSLPTGSGNISVTKGTYEAYGQKLTIDRGILSFAGPINNPGLDILAVRKNLAVEAGVAITGTALSPRVRLVSTPSVPDGEKLAWLTLGHGLDSLSGSELDVLTAAATAFVSRDGGPSFTDRIARSVGLDELSVGNISGGTSSIAAASTSSLSGASTSSLSGTSATAGTVEQRALTLGKRISSRLYLTYEMGLGSATRVARLQYELSRRWSVRAQAGTQSALDLFYTLRFD